MSGRHDLEAAAVREIDRLLGEMKDGLGAAGLRGAVKRISRFDGETGYTSEIEIWFLDRSNQLVDVIECPIFWEGRPRELTTVIRGVREDIVDAISNASDRRGTLPSE